jgi:hypothetical protein
VRRIATPDSKQKRGLGGLALVVRYYLRLNVSASHQDRAYSAHGNDVVSDMEYFSNGLTWMSCTEAR